MVMKALRDGASGGISKFILFGFMVAATAGLVFMDVGGVFRGGVGGSDIARIGDDTITAQEFDSSLRRNISQVGLSPEDALKFGYTEQLLSTEVRERLINYAASDLGLEIGNDYLTMKIREMTEPYMTDGRTRKDVLLQILRAQGITERSFIASVKRQSENAILIESLNSGFASMSPDMMDSLYKFQMETRDISYITFDDLSIDTVETPTEDELNAFYALVKEEFSIPETRDIEIVTIKDDAIRKTIDLSEDVIRDEYDSNIEAYKIDDTWILEQALVENEETANKIYETVQKNADLEAAIQSVTGNKNAYLGEKEFQQETLLDSFKNNINADIANGTVLSPIKSPLGFYIVKVKSFTPARTKPFDEVKEQIRADQMETRIIDQKYELADMVDDLFAGGATTEEIAQEIDIETTQIEGINNQGLSNDGEDMLDSFSQDTKTVILENILGLYEGEISPTIETEDGRLIAIQIEKLTGRSYKPLAQIKDTLEARWIKDQRRIANRARVETIMQSYNNAENEEKPNFQSLTSSADSNIRNIKDIERTSELDGTLPARATPNIFEANLDEAFILDTKNGLALALVNNIALPESINTQSDPYKTFKQTMQKGFMNEALSIYIAKLNKDIKPESNRRLLKQMYGGTNNQDQGF